MRVLFTGEPDNGTSPSSQNAAALASVGVPALFDDDRYGWRSRSWQETCDDCDAIHLVTYSQCHWVLLRKLWRARMRGVQIVRYWVGSDVLWARWHAPSRRFAQALGNLGTLNLAVADHLVDELSAVGVQAETVPVITPHVSADAEPHPLPKEFTVLCYLPTRRRAFYGGPVIDRLIRELPDVRFIILGDQGTDYSRFDHVESLGYVEDLPRTIGRSTVHVRPTLHDGMPRMVLEMLSHGRHAVTSYPYPHCQQAKDVESICRVLKRLRRGAEFNLKGREWVCDNFATSLTAGCLRDRIAQCLAPGRTALRRTGKWQATQFFTRCPWVLSRRVERLPAADELPSEAESFRLILQGSGECHKESAEVANP